MKKKIAYLLLAMILISCEQGSVKTEVLKKSVKQECYGQNIEIVIIDSCEYVYVDNGDATWVSHKGNCKFCFVRK